MNRWVVVGCLFVVASKVLAQDVTFRAQIAPIIFDNCSPCHQDGQIAPMPFTNYQEVSAYASMIKYVTSIRYMPPWKAVNTHPSFKKDRRLTTEEIELIGKWVEQGAVEGDSGSAKIYQPPTYLGLDQSDAVLSMASAFEQYGVYYDQFRVFVLPTDFAEDKMISSIEFVPGNPAIVRSCLISLDRSNQVDTLDAWDPQYGYFSFGDIGFPPEQSRWYTWYPGKGPSFFGKGAAKYLPQGSRLLLHIHYGPSSTPQLDSSYVKIKFSETPVTACATNLPLIQSYVLTNPPLVFPAEEKVRYHAKFTLPFDVELAGIMPHSHLLGRKWEIFAVPPQRKQSQVLLKIEDWDVKWKQEFDFAAPVQLSKGTVIHAIATYDNTTDNLLNPSDPPRTMPVGRRMYEEQFLVYFNLLLPVQLERSDIQILPGPSIVTGHEIKIPVQLEKQTKLNVSLYNFSGGMVGERLISRAIEQGAHQLTIPLPPLEAGNYYLQWSDDEGKLCGRSVFVKVKPDFLE